MTYNLKTGTYSLNEDQFYRLDAAARALSNLSYLLFQAENIHDYSALAFSIDYPAEDLKALIAEVGGEA